MFRKVLYIAEIWPALLYSLPIALIFSYSFYPFCSLSPTSFIDFEWINLIGFYIRLGIPNIYWLACGSVAFISVGNTIYCSLHQHHMFHVGINFIFINILMANWVHEFVLVLTSDGALVSRHRHYAFLNTLAYTREFALNATPVHHL